MKPLPTIIGIITMLFCAYCLTTGPEWFRGGELLTIITLLAGAILTIYGLSTTNPTPQQEPLL